MMYLIVPLSFTVSGGVTQLVEDRFVFTCKFHPVEGEGQKTVTVLVGDTVMPNAGAPEVCMAYRDQKPPVTV